MVYISCKWNKFALNVKLQFWRKIKKTIFNLSYAEFALKSAKDKYPG